jgi:hypothetical protein
MSRFGEVDKNTRGVVKMLRIAPCMSQRKEEKYFLGHRGGTALAV